MCAHYEALRQWEAYVKYFSIERPLDPVQMPLHVFPTAQAPMIRRPAELESGDDAVPPREVATGHFGLLPGFAKDVNYGLRTYNARSETVDQLPSFKYAWAKGRRCIIPCDAIYEPDWRTGKHIPTRITRADGAPLGVAGIWSPWKNPVTGAWHDSFAMLTINADTHPIFRELHRPDPKRPPEKQDKRMVVILNDDAQDDWLDTPVERAKDFFAQYPAEKLIAQGIPPAPKPVKPPKASSAPPDPNLQELF